MEEKILKTLRAQAWQRAKGEMRAALDTFWDEQEAFDIAMKAVNAATRAIADIDAVLSRRNMQPQAREFCESCDHGVVAGAVCADCGGTGYESEAPAPVDAGLVDAMLGAYWQDARPCETCIEGQATGMTAALRVAADVLLADPTPEEVLAFRHKYPRMPDPIGATFACYIGFRRARLLAPAKSAEERVTVGLDDYGNCWVCLDGKPQSPEMSHSNAEIYRLGLIATLKQESK